MLPFRLILYFTLAGNKVLFSVLSIASRVAAAAGCSKVGVQAQLPPALMMAPGRLRALLAQAAQHQTQRCRFHCAPRPPADPERIPFTLLADHHCSPDAFPIHSLQVRRLRGPELMPASCPPKWRVGA